MREKMEIKELEEKINYLLDLNDGSCDRPEVIEQRIIYIEYLKELLYNKKEEK